MIERAFRTDSTMADSDDDFAFEWEEPTAATEASAGISAPEPLPGWEGSRLQAGMHATCGRLRQLADTLNEAPPEIRVDYELAEAGTLRNLRQGDYELVTDDPNLARFTFGFRCTGEQRFAIRVDSRMARDDQLRWLARHGLDAVVEDAFGSQWHFTIRVRPMVPVALLFEADMAQQHMRMAMTNLDGLGTTHCSARADVIDAAFLDELEKLILRRGNRFAELTGNVVDNRVRQRMRIAIEARERRRAAELGDAPSRPQPGERVGLVGIKRLLGHRSESHASRAASSHRPAAAPTFVGPRDDEGALDWNTSVAGAPVVAPPTASATPAYGWLITKGDVEDTAASLGKLGPHGAARHFPVARVLAEGHEFRLRNRDGRVAYTGKIAGQFRGPEPVNDFGLDHGCMRIEYLRDGKWMELKLAKS